MRAGAKHIEFASVSVINVLQNTPPYNMQKMLMMVVRGKKKKSALQKKNPGLYLFIFSGQRKALQSHMFVVDN